MTFSHPLISLATLRFLAISMVVIWLQVRGAYGQSLNELRGAIGNLPAGESQQRRGIFESRPRAAQETLDQQGDNQDLGEQGPSNQQLSPQQSTSQQLSNEQSQTPLLAEGDDMFFFRNDIRSGEALLRGTENSILREESAQQGVLYLRNGSPLETPEQERLTTAQGRAAEGRRAEIREFGSYDALGIWVGTFLVFPEMMMGSFFTDNVLLSGQNQSSDGAVELRPSIKFQSRWKQHLLEGGVEARYSYFSRFSSENDEDLTANLRGQLDITSRTNLAGEVIYSITQENRGSVVALANTGGNSDIEAIEYRGTFTHRFNRLSVELRGLLREEDFDILPTGNVGVTGQPVVNNNDDRDMKETRETVHLSYQFSPAFTAFGEAEAYKFDFHQTVDSTGVQRSSQGFEFRGGIEVDITPTLSGELSLAYAEQQPDDPRLQTIDGILVDASLIWEPTRLTRLTLIVNSDIADAAVGFASGVVNSTFGLSVSHALRRHLLLSGGMTYRIEDFRGEDLEQTTFTALLGGEYLFNRSVALLGNYQFTDSRTSPNGTHYNENFFRLGLRLRR